LEEGFEECEHVSHTRGPGPLLARPFAVTLRPHAVLQAAQSTSAAAPPRKRPCKGVSGPPLASPTRSGRPRGGRRGCRARGGGSSHELSKSHHGHTLCCRRRRARQQPRPTKTTVQGRLWTTPGAPNTLPSPPGWATGVPGGARLCVVLSA
jgi:hypothetical protein